MICISINDILLYLNTGIYKPEALYSLTMSFPLAVSPSPRQTESETGSTLTLDCLLHNFEHCIRQETDEEVSLIWVDKKGLKMKNTTELWISYTTPCHITLTVNLKPQTLTAQRTWRCQLTSGQQQVYASFSITVKGL